MREPRGIRTSLGTGLGPHGHQRCRYASLQLAGPSQRMADPPFQLAESACVSRPVMGKIGFGWQVVSPPGTPCRGLRKIVLQTRR